jgi:penicillin-binding protein 1A
MVAVKSQLTRYLGSLAFFVLLSLSVAVGATAGVLFVYSSDLPQVDKLEDRRPSVITRILADDGQVIGSFAIEQRIVVTWDQIPPFVRDAIVSVEDQNFYEHMGIDFLGIARATIKNLINGRVVQGGSTLTQQLSKNLFLMERGVAEKSYRRKIQEMLLSFQIERKYTKQEILTMYANQNFMGDGQYGFAAAAEYYFGKSLKDVTIEEAALLAALQRSHNYSPKKNKDRALMRRNYVIDRMVAEKKISAEAGERAKKTDIVLATEKRREDLADYFVEEIRQYLENKYGPTEVLENGLQVRSTLNVELQRIANAALRQGLRDYDKRHGWRGAERNLLAEQPTAQLQTVVLRPEWDLPIRVGDIVPGIVLSVSKSAATIRIREFQALLTPQDMGWTKAATPEEILKPGDVALFLIRSLNPADRKIAISLEQKPKVQGAIVAIDSSTGEVKALVGGYNFDESKFNHATQARRQTGSVFKPFVYTVAVEQMGLKPDDTILDAPATFVGDYTPSNYDGKYEGLVTVRQAIAQSRNIPAVKTLAKLGVPTLNPYLRRFGITSKIEPYLPIALGAADVTLMEMTSAYSTFPNDGVRVAPRLIRQVLDYNSQTKEESAPELVDVIKVETAKTMVDLLQEPVRSGTATKLQELKRPVAGKTGTTNDFTDAWFIGFTPDLTVGVWVGFDQKVTLGDKETGGLAALPIWLDMMQQIHKDTPPKAFATGASGIRSVFSSQRRNTAPEIASISEEPEQ